MYWSYRPLREGAYQMAGEGRKDMASIYSAVAELSEKAGGVRCRKANLSALQVFEESFLPDIAGARSNFMSGSERAVDFGKVQLIGGPHFSVLDAKGQEEYVYLHPSQWTDEQIAAFCELLTLVLERRYNSGARNLWFLDLREGERVPWPRSKKLIRRKCERAAEFLLALQDANLTEIED